MSEIYLLLRGVALAVACTAFGTVIGTVAAIADALRTHVFPQEPIIAGTIGGFVSCALTVPLIITRPLRRTLPTIATAALGAALLVSFVAGSGLGTIAGFAGQIVLTLVMHARHESIASPHDTTVCAACGYSRRGVTSARCPECGARHDLFGAIDAAPSPRDDAAAS